MCSRFVKLLRNCGMALLIFGLFPLADVATAAQGETASIIGQVKDESGGVLPGVTVTATSPALQVGNLVAVTDERGEFRLAPLPIGTYVVEYTLPGFQLVRHENVRLTVGFVARLDVVLNVGALAETITVSGQSPIVDVTSTAATTQFTRETLELVPTGRSGIIAVLSQAPGVRTNVDVGGNTINTVPAVRSFGQAGEPWGTIEGIAASVLHSSGFNAVLWDYSVMDEVRVQTIGTDAAMPTRGVQLNVIVKSGGNDFHGTGWWKQTSGRFQSDNIDDKLRAQGIRSGAPLLRRWDVSGDLGGRIIRDKLWFFGGARSVRDTSEVLQAFKPDGTPSTSDQIAYWYTEKFSYQMSPSHRFVAFNQSNHKHNFSVGNRFTDWEARTDMITLSRATKGEWTGVLSKSIAMSVQHGWSGFRGIWFSHSDQPASRDLTTLRVWGEWTSAGGGSLHARHHTMANLNWYLPDLLGGNHELKIGVDRMAHKFFIKAGPRASGSYNRIFNNGVPFQIETRNIPTIPDSRSEYTAVHVSDSWSVGRRLTLNLGMRYAHDDGFVPERCYDAADPPSNAWYPAACYDRVQFKVWNTVAPRMRAVYDVIGDGKTLIKGGWGRYDHMRQVSTEVSPANPKVIATVTYRWRDLNGNLDYDPGEVNLNVNGPDFVSRSGGSNTIPNPNEKEPKSDEFSLGFEREVAANLAVRVTGVYSRTSDVYRLENSLRPYGVYTVPVTRPDPGVDGRVGTADDPGTSLTYYEFPTSLRGAQFERFWLTNDPGSTQTYKSIEVAATKRFSNQLQFLASYSATKKNVPNLGELAPGGSSSTTFASEFNPNGEFFRDDRTWEWVSKLSGSYTLPGDVLTSANFQYLGGNPWARQVLLTGGQTIPSLVVNVEPIGTRKLEDLKLLDVRAEKRFTLRQGHTLSVRMTMSNALNINTATSVTMRAGASFGRPTSIVPPRIVDFGATYAF